jgi:FkbM family methyltransferase
MLLIGISVVKNESDIIESFIRYNARFLDHMFVIDNGSTDTTPEILRRLADEWPGLKWRIDATAGHQQERIVTMAIRELHTWLKFDFAFPLDADEFILCSGRPELERELGAIPARSLPQTPWKTYVPTPADDWSVVDPIRRIVNRRDREPIQFYKVVVPFDVATAAGFFMDAGNHTASIAAGKAVAQKQLAHVSLAHFPLRSIEQLSSKALLGDWALSAKIGRAATEGSQWKRMAEKVVANMQVSLDDLRDAAAAYASPEATALLSDPLAVPDDCRMKWPELVSVNLLQRVVRHCAAHFNELASTVYRNHFMAIGKTEYGVCGYHLADKIIGASIKLYGEWALDEIRLSKHFLSQGDVVVDVGANIGTHAVLFARLVGPEGGVHAFEPQRLSYQMLCANAALNGQTNIYARQVGLSDAPGEARVPIPDLQVGGNFGNFRLEAHQQGECVPVVTLDSLTLPKVRLLKIDVEGMEAKVLRGGRKLIARDKPVILVENNIADNSSGLVSLLGDLGYRCWWHLAEYYNPNNYRRNPTNIFAEVGRPEVNLLCLYGSAEPEIEGLIPVSGPGDTWQAALARRGKAPR